MGGCLRFSHRNKILEGSRITGMFILLFVSRKHCSFQCAVNCFLIVVLILFLKVLCFKSVLPLPFLIEVGDF